MAEIQPIRVEIEREEDGRILASVPDLPGVMAYGDVEDEPVRKVKSIAIQVLADMIESGEDVPEPVKVLFAGCASGEQGRQGGCTPLCCILVGRSRNRSDLTESSGAPGGRTSRSASTNSEEIGPAALAKIGKETGLRPEDRWLADLAPGLTSLPFDCYRFDGIAERCPSWSFHPSCGR